MTKKKKIEPAPEVEILQALPIPFSTSSTREQFAEVLRRTKTFNAEVGFARVEIMALEKRQVIAHAFKKLVSDFANGILALFAEAEGNDELITRGELPNDSAVTKIHTREDAQARYFGMDMVLMHPDDFAALIALVRRLPPNTELLAEPTDRIEIELHPVEEDQSE